MVLPNAAPLIWLWKSTTEFYVTQKLKSLINWGEIILKQVEGGHEKDPNTQLLAQRRDVKNVFSQPQHSFQSYF